MRSRERWDAIHLSSEGRLSAHLDDGVLVLA